MQRAGETTDGRQQVDVRVSVFSQDDSPYQTTMRTVVGRCGGQTRPVCRERSSPCSGSGHASRPEVSYAPAAQAEWMEQVAKLQSEAATLPAAADVKAWETATTTTPGTPKPGTVKRSRRGRLGLVLVLIAAAAVLIPAYPSIARGVNNILHGEWDGSDMVTGLYQQESVDQMIAAAGTSQFTNLGFYPTYILGDALSRTGPDRTDEVQWRYGRAWVEGPTFIQSTELARELFDASELDISMVGQVARDAVQRSGIDDLESVYAFIRADYETGDPVITISLSGPYEDGHLEYTFGGELTEASGTAFE